MKDKIALISLLNIEPSEMDELKETLSKFVKDKPYDILVITNRKARFYSKEELKDALR